MTRRDRWRTSAATWAGAAWLVLQQFGVPAASSAGRDSRIVRVEDAATTLEQMERLPDGRILTVPVDLERIGSGQDGGREESSVRFGWN